VCVGGFFMDLIKVRVLTLANYIYENNATVRDTAKTFGISKSTVHKDVTERLKVFNPAIYEDVRKVLEKNKAERHLRGGYATKQKYLIMSKCKNKIKN
ncbi:MAG: sporulation transcriptional regulator SpoIIID, partial [Clostridia bacterium]|nr:sporulation transcriptional regulator SpoIIID [Clostridia bacterium]